MFLISYDIIPYRFIRYMNDNNLILLGRRIRKLRQAKGWTQQELGEYADMNYKFLGEIERGQQNPSFNVLMKIAGALGIEMTELFRFGQEITNRQEIEKQIHRIISSVPDENLRQILAVLKVLYPFRQD